MTKNATHTPGPWNHIGGANKTSNYDRIYRALVSVQHGTGQDFIERKVAYALGEDLQTVRANARLIAAAPELLATLLRYVGQEPWADFHEGSCGTHERRQCDCLPGEARAAIRKARGDA